MPQEHTIDELFEAMGMFSNQVNARFDKIEAKMVTKDYLDEVVANLRTGYNIGLRKEDHKLTTLIGLLK